MVIPASSTERAWLLALVCLGSSACAGEGAVTYHGRVMSADRARHVFVDDPSTDALPVEGARVVLIMATYEEEWTCANRAPQKPHASITGPDGRYRRELTFGSVMFGPDNVFLLCVSHPDHEPYEYRVVYEKSPNWETNGTKFLNFYLRRKSTGEQKGGK